MHHPPERNQRQQNRGSVSSWRQAQQPGAGIALLHHQQRRTSATSAAPHFLRSLAQVYCEHFITHRQDCNLYWPLQMLQTWVPSPHLPWRLSSTPGEDKQRFKQQHTHPACCTAGVWRESTSSPLLTSYTDHAHAPRLSHKHWKTSQGQKDKTRLLKHNNSDTSPWHLLVQASLVLTPHLFYKESHPASPCEEPQIQKQSLFLTAISGLPRLSLTFLHQRLLNSAAALPGCLTSPGLQFFKKCFQLTGWLCLSNFRGPQFSFGKQFSYSSKSIASYLTVRTLLIFVHSWCFSLKPKFLSFFCSFGLFFAGLEPESSLLLSHTSKCFYRAGL